MSKRNPEANNTPASSERIREIQAEIADLRKRWPAHSTPPAMMQRLDELEEELEFIRQSQTTE